MTENDFYINLANSVSSTIFVSGNDLNENVVDKIHIIPVWKYLYANTVYSLAYYYKDYLYNNTIEIKEMIENVRDYLSDQNCSDIICDYYYKGLGRQEMFKELLQVFNSLGKYMFDKVIEIERNNNEKFLGNNKT